ncbi:MAG: hypothetical protein RL674_231, partial [Pseudomonadota bacterium]
MKTAWINKPNWYQPELRTKTNYGGRVIENKIISKKTNLLITGSHHSGKTRAITRLYENAQNIWSAQIRPYAFTRNTKLLATDKPVLNQGESLADWKYPQAVFLCGISPMSKWVDHEGIETWWNENNPASPYQKIPAWKKTELIALYLRDTRAVLFIDNAHRLTGRKLVIAKECIANAYRAVIACSDENRLSPSIRRPFLETKPQIIRLNT